MKHLILGTLTAGIMVAVVGLYTEETFERLPVVDVAGNPVDDKAHIVTLEIE